jgi:hypothetical protein
MDDRRGPVRLCLPHEFEDSKGPVNGMSRTDKEVIQNLSGGTTRHEETENRRNAFLGFFYPHIRFVIPDVNNSSFLYNQKHSLLLYLFENPHGSLLVCNDSRIHHSGYTLPNLYLL